MSAGGGLLQIFILGVVALGLLGVLALGVYLITRKSSNDSDRKAGQ